MARTEGVERIAWTRSPTMMDNARMWPGGGWPEELYKRMLNGECPEASSVMGMGNRL
jgi:hypothetical protein